jgi:hypothetical protein
MGGALVGAFACVALAQQETPAAGPDRIEMVKQSFATSQKALREYGWIETVALSLGGEEKVKQQYQCYYGAEGKLTKVPVAADAAEEKKRGVRGKVAENKKAEYQAALKGATTLLAQYAPLDPAKIQAAKAAGNISVSVPGADNRVRVTIKDYLKPGDQVVVELDGNRNVVQSVAIGSFVDQNGAKNPVSASVGYGALTDGTMYPATETMEITAEALKVHVQNSGYKKQTP